MDAAEIKVREFVSNLDVSKFETLNAVDKFFLNFKLLQ